MRSSKFRNLSALAISTSFLATSAPAYAQLDEIVVTATKKEESLQDVSMSLTAFDSNALETFRIEGLEDIAQFTPGLYTYPAAANSNGVRIALRGVGTFDPQLGLDSKVAVYTDGVYMGKVVGLAFDSPDLERVEVLKGPQGTLYGRNAVAGAINLISKAPDTADTYGHVSASYGNYNAQTLKGGANIAFDDSAALRVSGQYGGRDGWVENLGAGNDYSGYERYGLRAALGIDLSPDVNLELAADYNKSTNEPHFYQAFDISTPTSLFAAAVLGATDERLEEFTSNSPVGDGFAEHKGLSATIDWDFHENHDLKISGSWRGMDSERYVSLLPQVNPQIVEGILNADINPAPGHQSIAGFVAQIEQVVNYTPGDQVRSDFSNFIPRSPITGLFQSPDGERSPTVDGHSQYSFETTSTGSFDDGKIEYTAGLYYFNEDTSTGRSGFNGGDAQDYLDVLGVAFGFAAPGGGCITLAGIPGLPAFIYANCALGGLVATDAASSAQIAGIYSGLTREALREVRFSTGNYLEIDTKAYAAYGQVTYNVSDDFRLIGGLRYSDETKKGFQQNHSPFFRDEFDFLGNPILPTSGKLSFSSLDPQAIVEYDVNDDLMLYASYSEAFRSGGFNASASQVPAAGQQFAEDFTFDPEEITSYEAGFKGEFSEGKFRLNASAFYYDIPNQQVTVGIDPVISTKRAIVNVPSEVYGFEAETAIALADGLTASGSMTYLDGKIGDIISPNASIGIVTRDGLQGTPKLSYLASLSYKGELDNGTGIFANLNYSHKDKVETTSFLYLTKQDLVSGRIGIDLEDLTGVKGTVALWGQNLFDDKYTVDTLPFETFAKQVHVFGTPRTYGVSLGLDF